MPPLLRTDADTDLFFLSANRIAFTEPTSDPWFSAHTPTADELDSPLYWADARAASALACTSQYQACDGRDHCTRPAASLDLKRLAARLWATPEQARLFGWFCERVGSADVGAPAFNLGASCLQARDGLTEGLQSPLPDDQWQVEVRHWAAVALAFQQAGVVNGATGPSERGVWPWVGTNVTGFDRGRCDGQVSLFVPV